MQQLHLVGLTTDLGGLIFSARKGSKSGGFLIELDDELLATIADTVRRRNGSSPSSSASSGSSSSSSGSSGSSSSWTPGSGSGSGSSPPAAVSLRQTSPVHESPAAEAARILAKASGLEARERRPVSTLSPREIQARLRAGHDVADIAADAAVDVEWIERFAPPVRAEQGQVVERAGQARLVRPRGGESTEPLAGAVRLHLAERGLRLPGPEAPEQPWSAVHVHESLWIVRLTYRARGREQLAEWEYDLRTNELIARNRLAAQLAFVEPGRRLRNLPLDEVDDDALAAALGTTTSAAPAKGSAPRKKRKATSRSRTPAKAKKAAKKKRVTKKKVATRSSPAAKKAAPRRGGARSRPSSAATSRSTRSASATARVTPPATPRSPSPVASPAPRPPARTRPRRPRPQR